MKAKALLLFILILLMCQLFTPAVAEEGGEDAVELPVLMYHSIRKEPGMQGKYVVSPAVFEEDLKYLSEHGYTAVSVRQLIGYVNGAGELPEKPVLLTFDDGHLNNLTCAVPLLEKYDMRAVVSVVGEYTETAVERGDPNPAYAYCRWEEISRLLESGRIEIGNHTYALHHLDSRVGCAKKRGESVESYIKIFSDDTTKLQNALQENCGCLPEVYTYPYGKFCRESEDLIKLMGFKASFSCAAKVNKITRDPDCLYLLGRFNRPAGISAGRFMRSAGVN